jgi:hypothetical protein
VQLATIRTYDFLTKLGVLVHDRRHWAVAIYPEHFWIDYLRSSARFHTTQDRVWLDGVEAKKAQLRRGQRPYVTAIAAPEFGVSDVWVSNGHHTLAAYLDLGWRPYVRCFTRAHGTSGRRVDAPMFDLRVRR